MSLTGAAGSANNGWMRVGLVIACLLLVAGCVSAPVKLAGKPSGSLQLPLQGVYKATVRAPFIGPVSARLSAAPSEQGFVANSREGVAWDMIGGLEGLLGQVLAPYLFPGGTIVTWRSNLPADGNPGEGWIGIGGFKNAGVKTKMSSPNAPIDLITPDGRRAAVMILEPCTSETPFADYPSLAAGIARAVATRLFDRELAGSSGVRGFLNQLKYTSRIARDDVEFLFGEAVSARNNLKIPMPIAIRRADDESRRLRAAGAGSELATIQALPSEPGEIATIRVEAFLDAADVDKAFAKVLDAPGLILDLRNCPGVTLSAMRSLCWMVESPTDGGFYFGPDARADALAGRMDGFPRVEIDSAAAVAKAEATLDAKGAAAIVIKPESRTFKGPVAVLISTRTTTSA
jgi:hypothetical protein